MNNKISKEGLEMFESYNERSKVLQPVLGVCCAGFLGTVCGVEPKTYYKKQDLKNYPSLELAIENANRIACGYYLEKWTEAKQNESDEAVNNIKELADALGIKPRERQVSLEKAFDWEF